MCICKVRSNQTIIATIKLRNRIEFADTFPYHWGEALGEVSSIALFRIKHMPVAILHHLGCDSMARNSCFLIHFVVSTLHFPICCDGCAHTAEAAHTDCLSSLVCFCLSVFVAEVRSRCPVVCGPFRRDVGDSPSLPTNTRELTHFLISPLGEQVVIEQRCITPQSRKETREGRTPNTRTRCTRLVDPR